MTMMEIKEKQPMIFREELKNRALLMKEEGIDRAANLWLVQAYKSLQSRGLEIGPWAAVWQQKRGQGRKLESHAKLLTWLLSWAGRQAHISQLGKFTSLTQESNPRLTIPFSRFGTRAKPHLGSERITGLGNT